MREDEFKRALIQQASLAPSQRVLDLGCDTATLKIMVKRAPPAAEVFGLAGDPRVPEVGRAKARRAGVNATLEHGLADRLPCHADSFDRVLSSLVTHHLTSDDKRRAFAEVYRVLRPAGEFHLADFGPPRNAYARLISGLTRRRQHRRSVARLSPWRRLSHGRGHGAPQHRVGYLDLAPVA
jgi:ubiquinone/menaquinone biosynthesis C-methylase UbiE